MSFELSFQSRVGAWMRKAFTREVCTDTRERNHRFLEEALELVQSLNCTREEAHQLVDYVFSRPVGEPTQEVGGTMVTLAALCGAATLDMHAAGEHELASIWEPAIMKKIQDKQATKPKFSPLPQAVNEYTEGQLKGFMKRWNILDETEAERMLDDARSLHDALEPE